MADLSEAIEAAAHAYLKKHAWGLRSTDDKLRAMAAERVRGEIEAAAPIIQRQVRAEIVKGIEAYRDANDFARAPEWWQAIDKALDIARGEG